MPVICALRLLSRRIFTLLLAGLLAGCGFSGGADLVDPLQRNLTWFSYLNAGDLRRACGAGAADRYRLVFNAGYDTHVRTYDILAAGGGGEALIRVFGEDVGGGLIRLAPDDLLGPWRGVVQRRDLPKGALLPLVAALEQDGAFGRPPVGMNLASDQVYWLVNACRAGRVYFHAWRVGPDEPALTFPAALRDLDGTGVPWPDPALLALPRREPLDGDSARDRSFNVSVTARGIAADTLGLR